MKMIQGPKTKKLIIEKMSLLAIPAGTGNGGLKAGLEFLSDKNRIVTACREATQWVEAAITAVRTAGDPNPWKTATDEEIAGEILRRVETERKMARQKVGG